MSQLEKDKEFSDYVSNIPSTASTLVCLLNIIFIILDTRRSYNAYISNFGMHYRK